MAHCEVGLQTKVQGDGQEEDGWRLKNRRDTMQSVVKEEPLCRQGTPTSGFIVSRFVARPLFCALKLAETSSSMRHGHVAFRPSSWLEFKEECDAQYVFLLVS